MKKRKLLAAVCVAAMAVSVVGCGSSSGTKETTAEVNQVTSPITDYKSVSELKSAIGFDPLELDASLMDGVKLDAIQKIDTGVAELEYEETSGKKETKYIVRTGAKGTDITGVYGTEYSKVTINGKEVSKGKADTSYVAFWTNGDYTYVFYGAVDLMDEAAFTKCLSVMVK